LRAPADTPEKTRWASLPGSRVEVEQIASTIENTERIVSLRGRDASMARVLEDLPRARRAHFATHGFFADSQFRSTLQLDPRLFERQRFVIPYERTRIAGRNPLVLSGLVMASANGNAEAKDADSRKTPLIMNDGGILTAEAIAGLPLHGVEIATLSACETGLGDVAGGEGVFGLQRAFHVAGTETVIASLWKIDNRATQHLMSVFYENLYRRGMSRLGALRQAQLQVLRGVDHVGRDRGLVRVAPPHKAKHSSVVATRLWAGWVLSGHTSN
jgi:CHAT domain-containing protein